jgi:hypothetical protein
MIGRTQRQFAINYRRTLRSEQGIYGLRSLSQARSSYPRSGGSSIESISGESRNVLSPTSSRDSGGYLLAGRVPGQRHGNAQRLRGKAPSCG